MNDSQAIHLLVPWSRIDLTSCYLLSLQDWLGQVQAMVNQLVASKQLLGTMDLNIQQMKHEVIKNDRLDIWIVFFVYQ